MFLLTLFRHYPQKNKLNENDKLSKCIFDVCRPLLQERLSQNVELRTQKNFTKYLETNRHYFYHQKRESAEKTCHCTQLSPHGRCQKLESVIHKVDKLSEAVFNHLYDQNGTRCTLLCKGKQPISCLHIYQPKINSISQLDFNDLKFFLLECDDDIINSSTKRKSLKEIIDLRNELSHDRETRSVRVYENKWNLLKDNIRNLYTGYYPEESIILRVDGIKQLSTHPEELVNVS